MTQRMSLVKITESIAGVKSPKREINAIPGAEKKIYF